MDGRIINVSLCQQFPGLPPNRRKYWGCRDVPGSICFLSAVKTTGYKSRLGLRNSLPLSQLSVWRSGSTRVKIDVTLAFFFCHLLLRHGQRHRLQRRVRGMVFKLGERLHDAPDDIGSSSQARQSRDFFPEFLLWSLCHHGPWDANALPQPFRNDDTGANGGEQENSLWPAVP